MIFKDRADAGRALARGLSGYAGGGTVVLGLPRGGVVVAAVVAEALSSDLDLIFAGKLRAPENPELAIGAVAEDGGATVNRDVVRILHITDGYVEAEKERRLREIREKVSMYRTVKKRVPLEGRTAVIVDDGIATGSTMIAAVHAASASGASRIIVAVPAGPRDTLDNIAHMPEVEKVVCPLVPEVFYAVSQAYEDFTQVEDEEVLKALQKSVRAR